MVGIKFDVFFSGQLMPGAELNQTQQQLQSAFKLSDGELGRLFCGKTISIKRGVDTETAAKYRAAFRNAGALVDIRRVSDNSTTETRTQDQAATQSLTLAPANSGTLSEQAPPVETAPMPDTSGLKLDTPGPLPDDHEATTTRPVDTGDLSLVPGDDWTFQDGQTEQEPPPPPDTSHLNLVEEETKEKQPPTDPKRIPE